MCSYFIWKKILSIIKAINEDLAARSRRNNTRITGVSEMTAMGHIQEFVETLLFDLFGRTQFSKVLVVE